MAGRPRGHHHSRGMAVDMEDIRPSRDTAGTHLNKGMAATLPSSMAATRLNKDTTASRSSSSGDMVADWVRVEVLCWVQEPVLLVVHCLWMLLMIMSRTPIRMDIRMEVVGTTTVVMTWEGMMEEGTSKSGEMWALYICLNDDFSISRLM